MSVVDTIKSEHEVIVVGLAVMENICRRYDSGGELDPECFEQLTRFFREFADRLHHGKEEKILFRAMEQDEVDDENDITGSLTGDHTLGRIFIEAMEDSITLLKSSDDNAAVDLVESARCYITMLGHHICRENRILCPMVEKELKPERLTQLADEFAMWEKNEFHPGMREEQKKIIEALRAEYGAAEDIIKLCTTK